MLLGPIFQGQTWQESLSRVTPSGQAAAPAELCSSQLLNIHRAQTQYILNIKQQLLGAGISIPQQSCWLFWEQRAASCGERDRGRCCWGRRAGGLTAAQELHGDTAPCPAGTAHSTQPCTPVLPSLQVGLCSPKLLGMHFLKAKPGFVSPKGGAHKVAPSNKSSSRPLVPPH